MGSITTRRVAQQATRTTTPGIYHCKVATVKVQRVGQYATPKLWMKLVIMDGNKTFVPFDQWLVSYELTAKNTLVLEDGVPVISNANTFGDDSDNDNNALAKLSTMFAKVLGKPASFEPNMVFINDKDCEVVESRKQLLAKDLKSLDDDALFLEDLIGKEVIASVILDKKGYCIAKTLYSVEEIDADHDVIK